MTRGTIYKNLWAGHDAYFVYRRPKSGATGRDAMVQGYLIYSANGRWELRNAEYYRRDVETDPKNFSEMGHIDIEKLVIEAVLREVSNGGEM